ncbi:MAG: hypothetical protein M3Y44_14920 [Actinomycetota bacterium]|nr:hypothetical protein [Actinomycetota bacterium]
MKWIRRFGPVFVTLSLLGMTLVTAPAANALTLPPGGGPAEAWSHRAFTTTYEGGSETCSMWLKKPTHTTPAGPVLARAALICPIRTGQIAGVFVFQAEGQSGQSTSGPIWAGACLDHGSCWKPLAGTNDWVYSMWLSYPNKPGLQLAYDAFQLTDPFNQCPGSGCLLLTWRVQR